MSFCVFLTKYFCKLNNILFQKSLRKIDKILVSNQMTSCQCHTTEYVKVLVVCGSMALNPIIEQQYVISANCNLRFSGYAFFCLLWSQDPNISPKQLVQQHAAQRHPGMLNIKEDHHLFPRGAHHVILTPRIYYFFLFFSHVIFLYKAVKIMYQNL